MNSDINTAANPSTDIVIDLSKITTYGELKKALPTTGLIRVPGINQLRRRATLLLRRETGSGTIEIYDNGFFVFDECGRQTVYGVDRCERPETYNNNGSAGTETPDFEPYPWEMILEAAGAARLAHNSDSRQDYQSEISLDAPASENNIAFSVMPEDEVREKEEAEAARRREMIRSMGRGLEITHCLPPSPIAYRHRPLPYHPLPFYCRFHRKNVPRKCAMIIMRRGGQQERNHHA